MAIRLESANVEWLSRASAPSINADYTVFMRIRRYTLALKQTLWYADAGTGDIAADWLVIVADDTIGFVRFNNAGVEETSINGGTVFNSTSTDYAIWLVRSGGTYSIYIGSNTTAEATGAGVSSVTATTELAFGAGTPGWDPSDVGISDLAVWTEAVSAANRAAVVAGGASAYTTNQWGRWKCDTHTALSDLSGNSRPLSANGTLSTVTDPVVPGGGGGAADQPFDLMHRPFWQSLMAQ